MGTNFIKHNLKGKCDLIKYFLSIKFKKGPYLEKFICNILPQRIGCFKITIT